MEFPQKLHRGFDINFFFTNLSIRTIAYSSLDTGQLGPLLRQLTPPYGQLGPLFKDNLDQYLV